MDNKILYIRASNFVPANRRTGWESGYFRILLGKFPVRVPEQLSWSVRSTAGSAGSIRQRKARTMRRVPVPLFPQWLRWVAVVVVGAVVGYFSLVTVPPEPASPSPFWDKYLHFLAYFGVALTLAYATAHVRERPFRRVAIVFGGAIAFGVAIELLQGVLPYRYFGWGDLLANGLGAALVALWFPIERQVQYVRPRRLVESLAPQNTE